MLPLLSTYLVGLFVPIAGTMAEEKRIMRGMSRRRQQEDISHARLDILFLMLFPLFFLFFNLVYWLSFLYGSCSNCDKPVYSAGVPQPACPTGSDPMSVANPNQDSVEQAFIV